MGFVNTREPSAVPQTYYNAAADATVTQAGSASTTTNLYGLIAENNDAANDAYLQFFNSATPGAVTLGTTPPTYTFKLPKGSQLYLDPLQPKWNFLAGLCFAVTTTRGGSTAMTTKPTITLWFSQS